MSDVYFVVIPVVIVVVILKLCLIFWRIWVYQKRRERVIVVQNQRRAQQAQPTARVIGVERCVGPDGFTQRTSYLVNQPGMPARQITRTIVIRPNDNRRPNDPNLPPSYDHAVTGRDKSVKVEEGGQAQTDLPPPSAPPPMPGASNVEPTAPPPPFQAVPPNVAPPPPSGNLPPPPAYTPQAPSTLPPAADSNSYDSDETSRLLV